MNNRRGKILRYEADRFGVFYVSALFVAQISIWRFASPGWAAASVVPLALLGILSAPINHNHQHVNVFRAPVLNRCFELLLAMQTGIGPYSWVLHHNLGHHLNYLTQRPSEHVDESRWTRHDGSQMGRFEYAVRLLATHQLDIQRVGIKHPHVHRRYLLMRLPLYGIVGVLLYLNPVNALLIFGLAPLLTLFHTCWVTYEHHAGLHTDDPIEGSYNRINSVYNVLSQNLGYHTAHHMRPGIHWSQLPEFHATIADRIPSSQITHAFW